ncbi:hypothetical protein TcasGA2_TC015017 [Tribolium castaneum]|uniref:Uncharacterized protein n=1 Tax=Tribolium castaneum TaxID=7070 RepID=D2A6B7_TRICA|nr:hypothetical protein TcasGA2_TC015017 [Tribolium castaneum]
MAIQKMPTRVRKTRTPVRTVAATERVSRFHPSYAIGNRRAHASVPDDIVSVEKNRRENKREEV